jgi:hypothetical protein
MKRLTIIAALTAAFIPAFPRMSRGQTIAQCIEQLALDYQKLSGMKQVLSQLYTDYHILAKGYNAVREVSQGNFDLHKTFLDGLLLVSPVVRQYPRIRDIIRNQSQLLSGYHAAWSSFRTGGHFSPDELNYMLGVYNDLVTASLKTLSDLVMVLSDGGMRMSDAERLAAIDRIYAGSRSQLDFLNSFNDQSYRLAFQRSMEDNDRRTLKTLYGK